MSQSYKLGKRIGKVAFTVGRYAILVAIISAFLAAFAGIASLIWVWCGLDVLIAPVSFSQFSGMASLIVLCRLCWDIPTCFDDVQE